MADPAWRSAWAWAISDDGAALLARAGATAAVLAAALALTWAARRGLGRESRLLAAARRRLAGPAPGLESRAGLYAAAARKAAWAAILASAALALAEIWIGGAAAWLAGGPGGAIAGRAAAAAFTVLAALAAWELVDAACARAARRGGGPRARTLLPLARRAAGWAIAAVAALTLFAELGISIGPLLAAAGVAGIAIGFGAQSIVKDVATGIFILLEDSIAVGDVVDLGGHSGQVEGMTLRTVRLRDLRGDVHIVPFGDVGSVVNRSKGFSYAFVEAGVAYKEDVDAVAAILREIAEDMRRDPHYGPRILEPLDVLGLESFGDSSVNIRVRLKTRPNRQWGVRREFHRRMKRAFDAAGVEIPFPHRTVMVTGTLANPKDEGGET